MTVYTVWHHMYQELHSLVGLFRSYDDAVAFARAEAKSLTIAPDWDPPVETHELDILGECLRWTSVDLPEPYSDEWFSIEARELK